jgi:hypothetical protein
MKNNFLIVVLMMIIPTLCFAETPGDQCYSHLLNMPELTPIANKMSFPDMSKASFEQLANTEKATDQEKPLISKYAEGSKICFDLDISSQPDNLHPRVIPALNEYHSNKMSLLIDLYNQKISYGEFIKKRQEASTKINSEFELVDREIAENNANLQSMQADQKRRAWADLFQGLSNAVPKPRPSINCSKDYFGNVTCR